MFVRKFAKTLKNNPKKSIFATAVLGWVGNWLNTRYNAVVLRRVHCENAQHFGHEPLHHLGNTKRLTVLLNPAANNGKATKMYEDYAAPVLHLAGCEVHMIKLKYEGEAKKLAGVLDESDMIVIAGGDGTLNEVVTGLLRRPDKIWKKVPIGVLPLGATNSMCKRLHSDASQDNQRQFVTQVATNLIEAFTQPVDVMKIESSSGKTVYGLTDIRWGTYSDLQEKSKKYWLLWRLKSYVPFITAGLRSSSPKTHSFAFSYTDPQDLPPPEEIAERNHVANTISVTTVLSNIFSRFWPWKKASDENIDLTSAEEKANEVAVTENDEPIWHAAPLISSEFVAKANTHLNSPTRDKPSLKVLFESDTVTYSDFVMKGPHTTRNSEYTPVNLAQDFEAHMFELSAAKEETDKTEYFSIDNERYEAMDIRVELMPNCIKMVCSKDK